MIKSEEKRYESSSGRCSIHAVIWYPDEEKYEKPVGVVQLVHGMIDHIERFTCMAEYFADKGYVVAGNDHLGHGSQWHAKMTMGISMILFLLRKQECILLWTCTGLPE